MEEDSRGNRADGGNRVDRENRADRETRPDGGNRADRETRSDRGNRPDRGNWAGRENRPDPHRAPVERRAIVLGGGGVAGVAWESALLSTLLEHGVTLYEADVVVGTSAGSVVGVALRSGRLVTWASEQVAPEGISELSVGGLEEFMKDAGRAAQVAGGEVQARAAIGALAREAVQQDDTASFARFEHLLPVTAWPAAELRVTAVDAADGSFSLFDSTSGVPLVQAIAASCAVPGVYPVVTIDGRPYMDGGARSATNADVAADCQRILVISCGPEPAESPLGPTLSPSIEALRASADVLLIEADAESLTAFGGNSLLLSTREPATVAGRRQGALVTQQVRAFWEAGA